MGISSRISWVYFLISKYKKERHFYRCAIETKWNYHGDLSLELFIFAPTNQFENKDLICVHDYGHTIQSLLFDPFMLFVEIISVI